MMNSLSDFTNLEYLNKGEYGLIYKATNKTDNKIYAIKEIKNNNNFKRCNQWITLFT